MEISSEKIGEVLKITIVGRLGADCTDVLSETLEGFLADNKLLLLDLEGMTYINSSGLGVLVHMLQKAIEQGGNLKLACLQPRPRIVFDITKVYRIFEIFDSVDAAIASFTPKGA